MITEQHDGRLRRRAPERSEWIEVLGHLVMSPLGVASGVLESADRVKEAAALGFDILTYSTVRARAWQMQSGEGLLRSHSAPFLREDISRARESLFPGQLLIVSIAAARVDDDSMIEDFMKAALIAIEGGAGALEIDFTLLGNQGRYLYLCPETVAKVAAGVKEIASPLSVIAKVGLFPNKTLMREVLKSLAVAGMEGAHLIHDLSLAREINREERLGLTLFGSGEIHEPAHFDHLREEGAKVALIGREILTNPYLALEYHKGLPYTLSHERICDRIKLSGQTRQ